MAIRVAHRGEYSVDELSRGANFRTEQEYNNLEVFDDTGRLIAAYAGDQWIAAVIVDGS